MKMNREFVILFVGRVAQAVIALVAIRILTDLLDKENIGKTYLVTTITAYFSMIFINPVSMYMNRRLHLWFQEKKLFSALRYLNWYLLAVACLSIPIVLGSYFYLNVGTGFLPWQICFLVFFNIYTGNWFLNLGSSLNMLERRGAFVFFNLTTQVLGLLASLACIFYFEMNAFFWLLGILIGQVLGAVFSWFYFVKKVQGVGEGFIKNKPFVINKTVLYFCLPIAFTTAFMWVQNQSYRVIVESKMGAETLALLGVGIGIAVSIAGLTESLVTQYFYPQYYSVISKGGPKERLYAWKVLYLNSVAVYVPVTLFVIAAAKYILRILVSSKFGDSVSLVMMGALIEFFRMMVNILYAVSQSEMKTRETVFPYIVGAGSVIGGLWLLLGSSMPIEIIFIPIVLVIAGLLVFLAMYWSMRQILPITLDLSFAFLCIAYSAPFIVLVLIKDVSGSLPMSLALIGTFGVYLLWAIWRLLRHIEVRKQSL